MKLEVGSCQEEFRGCPVQFNIEKVKPLSVLCLVLASAYGQNADLNQLLDGVSNIGVIGGVPGPLCLFGDNSFGIVSARLNTEHPFEVPLVAASRLGNSRLVAWGHNGFLTPASQEADTARLLRNAIVWAGKRPDPRIGVYKIDGLAASLSGMGFAVVRNLSPLEDPSNLDVIVSQAVFLNDADVDYLKGWINGGGSLIAASLGWGWKQLNPGKDLVTQNPGNRLFAAAGIVWADGTVGQTVAPPSSALIHTETAFKALTEGSTLTAAQANQVYGVLSMARTALPRGTAVITRLDAILAGHRAVPTPQAPVKSDAVLARLSAEREVGLWSTTTPEALSAHPAAATFPGSLPDADVLPRRTRDVTFDLSNGRWGWMPTGLYAPPGETVRITVPAVLVGKEFAIRIGVHSDTLWHSDSWRRFPEISMQRTVTAPTLTINNPFGGLIYLVVPENQKLDRATIKIQGAVDAPRFTLGLADAANWRDKIRHRQTPWTDLESERVVLTVPSASIRSLEDPDLLMRRWTEIVHTADDLAGWGRQRRRREHIVPDEQISVGYLHAGWPIGASLDLVPTLVNPEAVNPESRCNGNPVHLWGLFHEIGHNHQNPDWTFEGSNEVTVNLFTLYVFNRYCGVPVDGTQYSTAEFRKQKIEAFFKNPSFAAWQADPIVPLIMYEEMILEFGWDPFRDVFREYLQLGSGEHPKSDDEKRDQWMVRFSKRVHRNLGPFFDWWRVAVSQAAKDSVAGFPVWMPSELPVK
jgi:hypothetical protein